MHPVDARLFADKAMERKLSNSAAWAAGKANAGWTKQGERLQSLIQTAGWKPAVEGTAVADAEREQAWWGPFMVGGEDI